MACRWSPRRPTCDTPGAFSSAADRGDQVFEHEIPGRAGQSGAFERLRCVHGQQPPLAHDSQSPAVFGLIHIVRCDKDGGAAGRELVDQVPKQATRRGVDATGRLVEKEQARGVHESDGERQSLAPAG